MGLELRTGRGGKTLPYWYGSWRADGKRRVVNLGVPLKGIPPPSLLDEGDAAFERSRSDARAALAVFQDEAKRKGAATHLVERLIEAKTGAVVEYVKLADLPERWKAAPRSRRPSPDWLAWTGTVFRRFADAVGVEYLHEVTPAAAAAYVQTLRERYSRKTANDAIGLLRGAFGRFLPHGFRNPFDATPVDARHGTADATHRRPFTADELRALFDASKGDAFLHPLVVTAACTGMRRGDVASLRWSDVHLAEDLVTVKTSKTGAGVEIPVFPPLRAVLESALADRIPRAVHVFPSAVAMLKENPDGLTWRFKRLVAAALGGQEETDRVTLADVLPQVVQAVRDAAEGQRRERIIANVRAYAAGQSVRQIEAATGQARSGVSGDLHLAETLSGFRFMHARATDGGATGAIARLTRSGDATGRRNRASVLDWHSLRSTWVTLALSAGVPMEIVRRVTGHATVDVVLKHYFKPGRDDMRKALGEKLPDVLTGGKEALSLGEAKDNGPAAASRPRQNNKLTRDQIARVTELLRAVERLDEAERTCFNTLVREAVL